MLKLSNHKFTVIVIAILTVSLILCISSFVFKNRATTSSGLEYTRLFTSPSTERLTEVIAGTLVDVDRTTQGEQTTLKVTLRNSAGEQTTTVLSDFENGYNSIATRICKLDFCPRYGTVGFEQSAWSSASTAELKTGDEVLIIRSELTNAKVANIYQLYISR